jgi:hypothetical protein
VESTPELAESAPEPAESAPEPAATSHHLRTYHTRLLGGDSKLENCEPVSNAV